MPPAADSPADARKAAEAACLLPIFLAAPAPRFTLWVPTSTTPFADGPWGRTYLLGSHRLVIPTLDDAWSWEMSRSPVCPTLDGASQATRWMEHMGIRRQRAPGGCIAPPAGGSRLIPPPAPHWKPRPSLRETERHSTWCAAKAVPGPVLLSEDSVMRKTNGVLWLAVVT